jgi:hypothetical protein
MKFGVTVVGERSIALTVFIGGGCTCKLVQSSGQRESRSDSQYHRCAVMNCRMLRDASGVILRRQVRHTSHRSVR